MDNFNKIEFNAIPKELFLKDNGNIPIAEIFFLGTGGAFDIEEKNSSFLLKTANATVLIDCGFTVYKELIKNNLIDNIDYVFITHCHEDHIGSLSTLIYHNYFVNKKTTKIECIDSLKDNISTYLDVICGHNSFENTFEIKNSGEIFNDLNMIIYKIDTTNYHFNNYPSSGFVFNFKKNGNDIIIIYSGDINCPIIDIIKKDYNRLYLKLLNNKNNVFIFHEATINDYSNFPHCYYKKLYNTKKLFKNTFTYHHKKGELKEQKKLIEVINKTIDDELCVKLKKSKNEKIKNDLLEQSKNIKEEFNEAYKSIQIKEVNKFNNKIIII